MGKWDNAFPDSKQDFKDLEGKVINLWEDWEELHDRLDIPSFWFHGETIEFGHSFSFSLFNTAEQKKRMSEIVVAVTEGSDLVPAILAEPSYYSKLSNFYSYAKNRSMQGLPLIISSLTGFTIPYSAAISILTRYFSKPAEYFSNVTVSSVPGIRDPKEPTIDFSLMALAYIQKTGQYSDIDKQLYYSAFLDHASKLVVDMVWTSNNPIAIIDRDNYFYLIDSIKTTKQSSLTWSVYFDVQITAVLKTDSLVRIVFTDKMAIPNDSDVVLFWGEKYLFSFDTPVTTGVTFIMCETTPRYNEFKTELLDARLSSDNSFYPAIPIKLNGKYVDEFDKYTDMYEDAKGLSKALGIDFSYLKEAVDTLDGIKQRNVQGAYTFFGIDINSNNQLELEYVYRFFKDLAAQFQENPELIFNEYGEGSYELDFGYGMKVGEDAGKTALHQYFMCNNIMHETRLGEMPEDSSICTYHAGSVDQRYLNKNGKYQIGVFVVNDPTDSTRKRIVTQLIFCKKLSASKYEVITIMNPHWFVQTLANKHGKIHHISVLKLHNQNAHQCRIPLSKKYLTGFTQTEKNNLILGSLCINVMAVSEQYVDWFATEDFQQFIQIVSIIMTIWSLGTTASFWIWLRQLLIAYIAARAGAYIARKVGGDLGVFLGVVTTVAISYYGGGYSTTNNTTFMQASVNNALLITDSIAKINNIKIQEKMDELRREMALFDKNHRELLDLVEDAKNDLLEGSGIKYELRQLIEDLDLDFESPSDFLYRTTQIKNPGVLLLQEPTTYVTRHLQLPDYLSQNNVIE